jgi:hypothetical protein
MGMGPSPSKLELEAKLARYRDTARQHFDPNMRLATDELRSKSAISKIKGHLIK